MFSLSSGAPFTLASYVIEGGGSRNYAETKKLMYGDPGAWNALMSVIARPLVGYVRSQIDAGAQVIQIFRRWVGCLSPADYREYVFPHIRFLIDAISGQVPIIHFGTGTATLLDQQKEAGGDVIGLDWRVNLGETWGALGNVAVQGNLDPCVLLAYRGTIRRRAAATSAIRKNSAATAPRAAIDNSALTPSQTSISTTTRKQPEAAPLMSTA